MEETPTTLLLLLTLTLLLHFPITSSTESIYFSAAQTLIDSGFLSMALTLRLASPNLPAITTATIFVPSDAAFRHHGPLPLSLLQYHILPSKLPLQHLTSLPLNTPLPTLLPNSPLTVTQSSLSSPKLSLNNLTVTTTPLLDSPSLLILPLHDFFNSSSLEPLPDPIHEPLLHVLKSNNCSLTATFLEARLAEYTDVTKLTVFAPVDDAVTRHVSSSDYSAVLRKHVVPGLITWRDLIRFRDETLLPTFTEGFEIKVTVSPRLRLLNGVPVAVPDMYRSDHLVVHRVDSLLDNGMV